jgi:hypothetical protein
MSKKREAVYMSYLKCLRHKQLKGLEEWQYTRLSDSSTRQDAEMRLDGIRAEKHRRDNV